MIFIALTIAVAWVLVGLVAAGLCVAAAQGDAALARMTGRPQPLTGIEELRDIA